MHFVDMTFRFTYRAETAEVASLCPIQHVDHDHSDDDAYKQHDGRREGKGQILNVQERDTLKERHPQDTEIHIRNSEVRHYPMK